MIRVRFAAAPTGHLLLSSARVALSNYLFARRNNGQMLLRLDDLHTERSHPAYADKIMQDLHWLGIDWHDSFRQSERIDLYLSTIERLKRDDFLYPCFESEEELKAKQEYRRKRNQSPIYDRAMLSLTTKQRQDAEAGGKRPHWRLKLSGRTIEWKDLIQGSRGITLSSVSDPILARADGGPTAILASIVDDVDFGTTHILRGEDSIGNTAIQIELLEILAGSRKPVRFGHLPVWVENGRTPSAMRSAGSTTLRALRADGVEPCAVVACLAGMEVDHSGPLPLDDLAKRFDLTQVAKSRFEVSQMLALNRRALNELDFASVVDRLPSGATEAFWLAVRGSLDLLREAHGWWDVVCGDIVPPVVEDARGTLRAGVSLLPTEPWDHETWGNWIAALKHTTGLTGDALAEPLRLALTGENSGPDLADLLPLIGRRRAARRLALAAA